LSAFNKNITQQELDTVTLIQFEAPMIPLDSFSIAKDQFIVTEPDHSSFAESLNFKVAGRTVYRTKHLGMFTFDQLIENIHKLKWSCSILRAGRDWCTSKFVLVVRWDADQVTAERIGSFYIHEHSSEDAKLGPLGEESLTWRRVRLI
jgi:hypothetical protein